MERASASEAPTGSTLGIPRIRLVRRGDIRKLNGMRALSAFTGEWSPDFKRLAVGYAAIGAFFGIQLTLQNNFVVERLGIEPHELGIVEGLREVPGFLNFVFLGLMIALSPPLAAALCLGLMAAGIAAFSIVDTVVMFTVFSLIWSVGFHAWVPLGQTMALQFSPANQKGRALGQLRSVESLAWLVTIVVCILSFAWIDYGGLFVLAGVACAVGAWSILGASRKKPTHVDRSFLLRRRYWLYYTLQFLQGCRKQMFITFALFALVKVHGMPVETTMLLVFINQVLISLTGPWLGRMVDRHGERLMMSISYIGLTFIFIGYAMIQHRPTLYVLYCLDNLFFFGAIALTTYLHRIAPLDELKPTLSMGVTWNHISSVAAPLVGGFAWMTFGYEVIFFSGAVLAAISLVFAQFLPGRPPADIELQPEPAGAGT